MKMIIGLLMMATFVLAACSTTTVPDAVTSFEECVEAGYPVMESYPRQCSTGQETFSEPITGGVNETGEDLVGGELDENQRLAASTAIESLGSDGWTVTGVLLADNCDECYTVELERSGAKNTITVVDGEVTAASGGEWACTMEYAPVCGKVQVQCVTAPCPPIATTFGNHCEAEAAGAFDIVDGECVEEGVNPKGACLSFDGNWIPETQECEGMAQEQCEALGGSFDDCASACRNDPDAEMCTMQCVLVCSFA